MVKRILRNKRFLQFLAESKGPARKNLIKMATSDQVTALRELALNAINKNIEVPAHVKTSLCKHKRALCALTLKNKSCKQHKNLLLQKGAGLPIIPILLKAVLPIVLDSLRSK